MRPVEFGKPSPCVEHRVRDPGIGTAPAEISTHAFAHTLGIVAGLTFLDQADRAHRRAVGTRIHRGRTMSRPASARKKAFQIVAGSPALIADMFDIGNHDLAGGESCDPIVASDTGNAVIRMKSEHHRHSIGTQIRHSHAHF